MGSVLWGTMASDLAVWAAFGVTVVVLASAIVFFVKRGVGVSRAVAWASVVALVVEVAVRATGWVPLRGGVAARLVRF